MKDKQIEERQECKMEEKRLLPASKVQSALFIYTGSIIYIVCALLIYSFFISALFVLVEIFILR